MISIEIYIASMITVLIGGALIYGLLARNREAKLEAEIEELKKAQKKETFTIEASQILHDLTRGEAIVRVIPISPNDVFWRSPK